MSGVSKTIIIPDGDDDYYYEELNDEVGSQQSPIEEKSMVRRVRGKVHRGQPRRDINLKMRQPNKLNVQNEEKGTKRRMNEEKRKTLWDLPSTSKQTNITAELKRLNSQNEVTTPGLYQVAQASKNTMSPEVDTTTKTNRKMRSRTQVKNTQNSTLGMKKEVPWSAIVHSISMNPRNAVTNTTNVDNRNDEPEDLSKEKSTNLTYLDGDHYTSEDPPTEQEISENQGRDVSFGNDMNVVPVIEYAQPEYMSTSSQSSEENYTLEETQDLSVKKNNDVTYNEPETKGDSQSAENTQGSALNPNAMERSSSSPSQMEPATTEQQQNEAQHRYFGMLQHPLNVSIEDQLELPAGQVWNIAGIPASQMPQETVQLSISVGDNVRIVTPCALVQPVEVRGILQAPISEASTTVLSQTNGTPLQLNIANVNINIILPQSVNSIIHDLIPVQPPRNTVAGQGLLTLAQPQVGPSNMQNYEMISPTTTAQHETQQIRPMHVAPAHIHSAYSTYSVQSNSMPRMATGARRVCHSNNQGLLRREQYLSNYSGVPYHNILRQNSNPWPHNHPNGSYYHPVPYSHHMPRHMARPPPPPYHLGNRCDCNHCPQTLNPYNRAYNTSNMLLNPRQPTHDHNYPLNLQARRHPKA